MITLTKATTKAIRYACMNFHYAKSVPSVKHAYNVYNDNSEWCGVIIYSQGATMRLGNPFGLAQGEILELVRVALNGKQETTSECVAASLKRLHHDNPAIKMVVSFADTDKGHIGTIYQATNWIYLGMTVQNHIVGLEIHGRKLHCKSVYAKYGTQSVKWVRENVDPNVKEIIGKGKHKYIYCFDKRMRKKYLQMAKPYPKNT